MSCSDDALNAVDEHWVHRESRDGPALVVMWPEHFCFYQQWLREHGLCIYPAQDLVLDRDYYTVGVRES